MGVRIIEENSVSNSCSYSKASTNIGRLKRSDTVLTVCALLKLIDLFLAKECSSGN
jgi:hypothetical protein